MRECGCGPDRPFGYNARSGYYLDRETGLYCCQARYYDPMGRWVTRDPIGYAGGVSLYGYCGEGPVGAADPEGLKVWIVGQGGAAVDPKTENEVRRQLKVIGSSGSPLQQMMQDLITDKRPHYVRPYTPDGDPASAENSTYPPSNQNGENVYYDPWHCASVPGKGDPTISDWNGFPILTPTDTPFPPDPVLAHELGHQPTDSHPGRRDPGNGTNNAIPQAGDNVADVENPYRHWRGLPRRALY